MSIFISIIGVMKYVIKTIIYITSVTQFHELDISNDYWPKLYFAYSGPSGILGSDRKQKTA